MFIWHLAKGRCHPDPTPTGRLPTVRLQVLEACMKNCGRRFHNEVGKFRFLNELIKVVSPKVSRGSFLIRRNFFVFLSLPSSWFSLHN